MYIIHFILIYIIDLEIYKKYNSVKPTFHTFLFTICLSAETNGIKIEKQIITTVLQTSRTNLLSQIKNLLFLKTNVTKY